MLDNKFKVTSNYHWYTTVSWYDLPSKNQEWFDYIEGEDRYSPRMVKYRGTWYDLSDGFIRIHPMSSTDPHAIRPPDDSPLQRWHGAQSDSYFSGVLVKYDEEYENVQMGTYTS